MYACEFETRARPGLFCESYRGLATSTNRRLYEWADYYANRIFVVIIKQKSISR
jgi:hypothetical protein